MTRLLVTLLAAVLTATTVLAQFSYDNPTYFPSACKKQGQIAVIYAEGPSKYTSLIYQNLVAAGLPAANMSFFPVTTYLKDVTSNVPLSQVGKAGAFIGMRWTTQQKLNSLSAAQIATQLESDCTQIMTYTGKAPKYIFLPRDQVDETSYNAVKAQGYVPVAYNLDSLDYTFNGTDNATCINGVQTAYIATLGQLTAGSAYWIALQRDLIQCTVDSAATVYTTIKNYGYTWVDIGTCLGDTSPYKTSCTASGASAPPPASAAASSGASATKAPSASPSATTAGGAAAATGTAAAKPGAAAPARFSWSVYATLAIAVIIAAVVRL
ncbi:carbohydrate esterase family 4 protein [Gonapodya prolifera JEL478]|uniref:Carbohydrate esterase family 4 protein n=1 Tax=Gonapodya prolifera (strain JEL478) TaxID=1344416 RepID=A0A139A2T5_GONPJ|nr:carbohydrate esterase family 4 protein [Gonapodya prolifera JEL478]|eukprot:KXS11100.1 carbohydrate esterase family 4 protein [Gonapodya prolifera JEL478]